MSANYAKKAQDLIAQHRFLMISKSWCPDCHYADRILSKYKVADKVHVIEFDKLEDQKAAVELEKAFTQIVGRKWVPTFFFNHEVFRQELAELESLDKTEETFTKLGLLP